ncbi:MAG: hypothetical protein NT155_03640 [Candidatus Staskawiczbacteria bacterium]|nr:hypothetical protein [Candidatus Staskawiczbacteria bacterium]
MPANDIIHAVEDCPDLDFTDPIVCDTWVKVKRIIIEKQLEENED